MNDLPWRDLFVRLATKLDDETETWVNATFTPERLQNDDVLSKFFNVAVASHRAMPPTRRANFVAWASKFENENQDGALYWLCAMSKSADIPATLDGFDAAAVYKRHAAAAVSDEERVANVETDTYKKFFRDVGDFRNVERVGYEIEFEDPSLQHPLARDVFRAFGNEYLTQNLGNAKTMLSSFDPSSTSRFVAILLAAAKVEEVRKQNMDSMAKRQRMLSAAISAAAAPVPPIVAPPTTKLPIEPKPFPPTIAPSPAPKPLPPLNPALAPVPAAPKLPIPSAAAPIPSAAAPSAAAPAAATPAAPAFVLADSAPPAAPSTSALEVVPFPKPTSIAVLSPTSAAPPAQAPPVSAVVETIVASTRDDLWARENVLRTVDSLSSSPSDAEKEWHAKIAYDAPFVVDPFEQPKAVEAKREKHARDHELVKKKRAELLRVVREWSEEKNLTAEESARRAAIFRRLQAALVPAAKPTAPRPTAARKPVPEELKTMFGTREEVHALLATFDGDAVNPIEFEWTSKVTYTPPFEVDPSWDETTKKEKHNEHKKHHANLDTARVVAARYVREWYYEVSETNKKGGASAEQNAEYLKRNAIFTRIWEAIAKANTSINPEGVKVHAIVDRVNKMINAENPEEAAKRSLKNKAIAHGTLVPAPAVSAPVAPVPASVVAALAHGTVVPAEARPKKRGPMSFASIAAEMPPLVVLRLERSESFLTPGLTAFYYDAQLRIFSYDAKDLEMGGTGPGQMFEHNDASRAIFDPIEKKRTFYATSKGPIDVFKIERALKALEASLANPDVKVNLEKFDMHLSSQ